jgi:hypothetical protein
VGDVRFLHGDDFSDSSQHDACQISAYFKGLSPASPTERGQEVETLSVGLIAKASAQRV